MFLYLSLGVNYEFVCTSMYTVKKGLSFSRPQLFPAKESLVGDIPAGDGKIVNLFYSVIRPSWLQDPFPFSFDLFFQRSKIFTGCFFNETKYISCKTCFNLLNSSIIYHTAHSVRWNHVSFLNDKFLVQKLARFFKIINSTFCKSQNLK